MLGLTTPVSWKTQEHPTVPLCTKVGVPKLHFALQKGSQSSFVSSKHSVTYSKGIWNHLASKGEGLTGGWEPPRVKLCRRRPFEASPSQWDALSKLQNQEQQHHFREPLVSLTGFIYLKTRWTATWERCLLCFKWGLENQRKCKKRTSTGLNT